MSTGRYGHPGHNSHDADAEFGRAIESFVGDARIDEALRREAIAELRGGQRLILLRNTMLMGLVRLCRRMPKMDCTATVYFLIVALSDNDDGFCWLSQRRMAQILSRAPTTISEAIGRLLRASMIQIAPGNGENNAYWPTIPPVLPNAPAGVRWFIESFSTPSQQVRSKTPSKSLADRLAPSIEPEANASAPGHETHRLHGNGSLGEPFGSKPENPSAPRDTTITKIDSTEIVEIPHRAHARKESLLSVQVESWHPTEEQQGLYHGISLDWGGIAVRLNPDAARQSMLFAIRPHRHVNPKVLSTAVDMTLACCHAAKLGGANSNGTAGAGRVQNYFATVLAKKIEEVRVASFNSETAAATITEIAKIKVATEQEAKELKIKALGLSIEGNAARRALAAPGTKTAATGQNSGSQRVERFGPMEKFPAVRFTSITSREANFVLDDVPGATKADVERAFVAVSGELGSSKSKEAPPLDTILATWRMQTWRRVAKQKFPTPAELCGGAVARYHSADEPGDTERLMQRKWCALSQPFVDGLLKEFPTIDASEVAEAFGDLDETDFDATAMDKPIREYERYGNLEATFQPACYGTTLQAAVEAYVRKRVAKLAAPTVAQEAKLDKAKRLDPSLERRVLSEAECKALAANQTPGEAEFEPSQAV